MKAFVINSASPSESGLVDLPMPQPRPDEALVQVIEVGVDATDMELIAGKYGEPPENESLLIIGHESLGRVVHVPHGSHLSRGDLVVAMVRRPDPEPCLNCAAGESDMCSNGRFFERGIKGAHGFLAEFYTELPEYLVQIPAASESFAVLLEPLSIVEKAVEQIRRIQARLRWAPRRAVVLGAGTIGTLGALLLRLEGLDVYLYSRGEGGPGRRIAEQAGVHFLRSDDYPLDHELSNRIGDIDIIVESTGFSPLAFNAIDAVGPNGIVCLLSVTAESNKLTIDSSHLNLEMVILNKVAFGSVNANRRHFLSGVQHLKEMQEKWPGLLPRFVTKRIPLSRFKPEDIDSPGDLKVVVEVSK